MRESSEKLKELEDWLARMADWAKANPGTAGIPASLADGGPGDSDCITTYLASVFHAAGQRCRLVFVQEDAGLARNALYAEVFHPKFGKTGTWSQVLPFGAWIFEGPEILSWRRVAHREL